ncbi:MAG: YegS/Rv2252/BmrU family lipid kinase [Eubacteriaceae bacterium]|nr:YegS/Rv2252/BmrU family lipid kinase [Eubacteriaceae bacterium]
MIEGKREKVLLFYNPHSGNGLFKNNLDPIIEKYQAAGYQIIPVRSARGIAIDAALDEIDVDEYRQILVAGGDGTINLCVNAMIKRDIDLPLGIFPTGTANDFAYYFDLPSEIEDMIDVALGDHISIADVGVCNNRYFINVAALGTLVDVSQKTDPNLKNTLGVFSYYLKGLSELTNLKPLPVRLITPKKTYKEDMYFMVVMNGKSAGGFKKISPESEINDGLLDVILFRKMPIVEFGPLLVNVLQGNHPKNRHVLVFQTDDLRIESDIDISTDVDGEKGEKLPLQFSVLRKRLKIFTPENKTGDK